MSSPSSVRSTAASASSTGTVRITDNQGKVGTFSIDSTKKTIGDVLEMIGQLGLKVQARINDAGDGILLIDTAGGGATFKIEEGNSTTARDLSLLAEKKTIQINNIATQVIDGTTTYQVDITETDNLADLATKINALSGYVRSSVFNDGSAVRPYRFTLFNQSTGRAGQLLLDTSQTSFTLQETAAPRMRSCRSARRAPAASSHRRIRTSSRAYCRI